MKQIPGTRQVLLGFDEGVRPAPLLAARTTLRAIAHRPFLPLGLLLWGVTDDTYVTRIQVGNLSDGNVSGQGRIPARLFETHRSLTELRRLAELGELPGAIDARAVMEMEAACVGALVTVELEGPCVNACLWGLTYTDGYPFTEIEVTRSGAPGLHPPEGYAGRVREHTLDGVREKCKVSSPTVESVTALLAAFARPASRL